MSATRKLKRRLNGHDEKRDQLDRRKVMACIDDLLAASGTRMYGMIRERPRAILLGADAYRLCPMERVHGIPVHLWALGDPADVIAVDTHELGVACAMTVAMAMEILTW